MTRYYFDVNHVSGTCYVMDRQRSGFGFIAWCRDVDLAEKIVEALNRAIGDTEQECPDADRPRQPARS